MLVVDDEADFRTILSDTLTWAGHDVTAVPNVPAARNILATAHPDVVIADLNFGSGPTGVVLAKESARGAGSSSTGPAPVVIACSGHPDLIDSARQSGVFSMVLEKPCDLDVLVDTVNEVNHAGG